MQRIINGTNGAPSILVRINRDGTERRDEMLYCNMCGNRKDYDEIRSAVLVDKYFLDIEAQMRDSLSMCLGCIRQHFYVKLMVGIIKGTGEKKHVPMVERLKKRSEWVMNFCVKCGREFMGSTIASQRRRKLCAKCDV